MFSYTDAINSKTTVGIIHDSSQPERFYPMIEVAITNCIGSENVAWLDTDIARELAAAIIARCDELDEGRCQSTDEGQRCGRPAGHITRHRSQDMRSWDDTEAADRATRALPHAQAAAAAVPFGEAYAAHIAQATAILLGDSK